MDFLAYKAKLALLTKEELLLEALNFFKNNEPYSNVWSLHEILNEQEIELPARILNQIIVVVIRAECHKTIQNFTGLLNLPTQLYFSLDEEEDAVMTFFEYLIDIHSPQVTDFIKTPLFKKYTDTARSILVVKEWNKDYWSLAHLFQNENTGFLLEDNFEDAYRPESVANWRIINPDFKKKRQQRALLVRFWLIHVRKMIPFWIDHLYRPNGPMCRKGQARFYATAKI